VLNEQVQGSLAESSENLPARGGLFAVCGAVDFDADIHSNICPLIPKPVYEPGIGT